MAAPTYGKDLVDIDLAAAITNWYETTVWADGGAPTADADYPAIQGSPIMAITQGCTKATYASLVANAGGSITIPSDGAALVWQGFANPPAIDTLANGGFRVIVGNSTSAFYWWPSGGNNSPPYPTGLWQNVAVNPSVTTNRTAVGGPSGVWQYFGSAVKLLVGIGKGCPHAVDAIRYGRCEARFQNGDLANGYCTFAGFAAQDDAVANRWGLIRPVQGGYLWKGLITVGYNAVAADWRDSDVRVFIDDTRIVTAAFNTVEVRVATSKLYWTRVSITSLGTTSPGTFTMVDAADVRLDGCQFTGWGAWTLKSTAICTRTTWLNCGVITAPGSTMTGCSVLLPTVAADASAVVWDVATNPDGYLDGMVFSKGANAHHAITFGTTSPTSITLRGWVTSGFNAANGQNDSTFYVARTTGSVTIAVVGGNGNFSYKSAGAAVTVVIDPVTVKVTCIDQVTKNGIQNAAVTLYANGAGPFPYNASVTITRSGQTATVTHTNHGLSTGDKVWIKGANQKEYNRIKTITYQDANHYTYQVEGTPDTPATGTITSTMVFIDEVTPADGAVSISRVFSSSQAVAGYASKGTTSPFYVRADLTGTVSSSTGISITAVMVRDG